MFILFLPLPDIVFIDPRLMLFEISQPSIQLSPNVIQVFEEIVPVTLHLSSAEVLPDLDLHLFETASRKKVPLRPNEEEVGLENFDVFKSSDMADNVWQ